MYPASQLVKHYTRKLILIVIVAIILRVFVISVFFISDEDMSPVLQAGDFVVGLKSSYIIPKPFSEPLDAIVLKSPQPGDVVAFTIPGSSTKQVRRVLATGGDLVEFKSGEWLVNGRHSNDSIEKSADEHDWGPHKIGPDTLFFIAEKNRAESGDSRVWNEVPVKNVDSQLKFVLFSIQTSEKGWHWRGNRLFQSIK